MVDFNHLIYFTLLINTFESIFSLTITCPSGGYPNNLTPVLVWIKYFHEAPEIYRIGSTELKEEYSTNSSSNEIFLNSGIPTACPKHCTLKLSTNIRSTDGVILHQDNAGRAPPPGYIDISGPKELYCARSLGDCGANAPIYRYKHGNQLINRYAYSFRANDLINGYTREVSPICYGWKDGSSSGNEIKKARDPTDCEPIRNVSNGQIIYKLSKPSQISETIVMGSFATLSCNEGYKPSMQNQVACITGTWYPTDQLGECVYIPEISKNCTPLPLHENGYIVYSQRGNSSFPSGTSAYLLCTGHYRLTFNKEAQCVHGQWSTLKLGTCQPIGNTSCAPLSAVKKGKVKYLRSSATNVTIGTIAELKCLDGYVVNGLDILICEPHGWSPAPIIGTCQKGIRSCYVSSHPAVSNGELVYSNKPNSLGAYPPKTVAAVRCNNGYTIYGALLSTCEDFGWKPSSVGVCVPLAAVASVPPRNPCLLGLLSPVGGTITYSNGNALAPFPSGTVAVLECLNGVSHGSSLAACDDGSWIPPELGSCSLPHFHNSSSIRSVFELISCLSDYPATENGIVVYSNKAVHPPYPALTRANVQCNSGYIPLGSIMAICQNGAWYPPIPAQCIPYSRKALTKNFNDAILSTTLISPPSAANLVGSCVTGVTPPENGYISYSTGANDRPFPSGTVATINCDYGFKLVGTKSSTCLSGIWSPLILGKCVGKGRSRILGGPTASTMSVASKGQCAALPAPINGRISYSSGLEIGPFPTGTTATVTCNRNHILLGISSAVCYNGVFTPLLIANCIPEPANVESLLNVNELPCIPIPKTLNGDVRYSDISATVYASKTTATLQCNRGFVPVGAEKTVCNNGQWQPVLGFCQQGIIGLGISQVPISPQCLFELPSVTNGHIRYSTGRVLPPYESGTIATVTCINGGIPVGKKSSTCMNGSWNPLILGKCPGNGGDNLGTALEQTTGCPPSPPISNGKVYYSNVSKNNIYPIDTVANLYCNEGYQILGRSTSYCQGGIWSPWPGVGSCQPSVHEQQHQQRKSTAKEVKPAEACSEISITPSNGMIIYESNDSTTWYNNGARAKLQCNVGYKIDGEESTHCQDGHWLPSIGRCKREAATKTTDSCEPFISPSNGRIYYIYNNYTKYYQVGTTALLSCDEGYRIRGATTLICSENGWMPHGGFGICISADDNNFNEHAQ
ncbi:unnamed protein product [Litomosoides sigmodontis]|uniref:Sushi domain-containing protein n=1 Tax=Litomosoides sigmodontis TaxID=42156 RepID=A0A3P6U926_LITSI|nr:unnamed protein product [Litomosoides sigmodontis]